MHKFLPPVLFVCLCFLAVLPAAGQITITTGDVDTYFAPGGAYTSKVDTATNAIDIGSLGATSWDFSGLTNYITLSSFAVRPDTTAFAGYYPSATHAIRVGSTYSYFLLGTDLQMLGVAQPSPSELRTMDLPPQVIQKMPMTFGTTWTATYAESSYVTFGGTTYPSRTDNVVDYTVDAYGPMTLPGGSVHQVLRLKSDRRTSTDFFSYRIVYYQFLGADGSGATVSPVDTLQAETGIISAASVSWIVPTGTTSAGESPDGGLPARFALEQNYPNPFNPSTTIRFSVEENSFVSLKVYNMLGEEVAALVSSKLAPGSHTAQWDAAGLPSGAYLCRLRSGAREETRTLVLIR